ncbi:Cobalt-zinc-cadmium resistance protein CzcB [Novipirellula aureliae]|uniref:Cobalt-zinc-cadmium resistance protein CzcB n=1 Tax=Novipirellula aureliae TaxID=2527966 RepID=A0A5C6E8T8_9BACT|nr:efflux RND transporter periplasmic adaptor subunit [Novipirellula aureliae]TWU44121.1 Cobalt-zinc-cadmium resistance protein CzcB [Novipirellula aureliae]
MKSKTTWGVCIALSAVIAAGWYAANLTRSETNEPQTAEPTSAANLGKAPSPIASRQVIRLNATMQSAAGMKVQPVSRKSLQLARILPARFAYDDTRHVSLRTPTEGVIESVRVQPGDRVEEGQAVAILRSPTIGRARNQVLTNQANRRIAEKAFRWEADVHEGVAKLVKLIRSGASMETIERSLKDETLGDFGGKLRSAYSQARLASDIVESIGRAGDQGAISGRLVLERRSDQQQKQAVLESTIQQSLFQTQQSLAQAQSKLDACDRELRIAKQTLNTLLGSTVESTEDLDVSPNDPNVSRFTICSPLAGTVERRVHSATERVATQDELFVIADTRILWVEADIRGNDWGAIDVATGDTVFVSTPAFNTSSLVSPPQSAIVVFWGRNVDPSSGSIPLVAQIDNSAGKFRPGMFARMTVPTQTLEDVIAIPESAVVDIEGQDSVFVQVDGGYRAVAVDVGERSSAMVEIRSGLTEDESIVVAGAFILKSELLLEGEE